MIGYLDFSEAIECLRECRRVLKPGRRIRIATPSLEQAASLVSEPLTKEQKNYVASIVTKFCPDVGDPTMGVFAVNTLFYAWRYKFVHDRKSLRLALERAGFGEIVECPVGESSDPELVGVEVHGDLNGLREVNRFETFVLEASRPEHPNDS